MAHRRSLAGLAFVAALANAPSLRAQDLAGELERIAVARSAYSTEIAAISSGISDAIEQLKERISKGMSADVIRATRAEVDAKRAAFETSGALPKKVHIEDLKTRWSAARSKLRQLYDDVESDLLLADSPGESAASKAEREALADGLQSDRAALLAVEDLAPWRTADPFFEHVEETRRWTFIGTSYTSPTTKEENARTPVPFELKAVFESDALHYALTFDIERIQQPGAGLDVQFQDWNRRLVVHHITAAQFDTALRSKAVGKENSATVFLAVQDGYARLDVDGVTLLRRTTSSASADDTTADEEDPWFALVPQKGAQVRIHDVQWKPLRPLDAGDAVPVLPAPRNSAPQERPAAGKETPKQTESKRDDSAQPSPSGSHARSDAVQRSIRDGLAWLARHQNANGSWTPVAIASRCDFDDPAYEPKKPYLDHYDPAVTALAVLCFLRAGYDATSTATIDDAVRDQRHVAGPLVERALAWLVARQNADGSFSKDKSFMYNEAAATLALVEAAGTEPKSPWRAPAQKALDFLCKAQRPSPSPEGGFWGWRYTSRQEVERSLGAARAAESKELYDSDTSITGWCIAALESGQRNGFALPAAHEQGGLAFARFATQIDGGGQPTGLVGYLDPKGAGSKVTGPYDQYVYHPAVMSALAVLIQKAAAGSPDEAFVVAAADQIIRDQPLVSKDRLSVDYYYWHHATHALSWIGGPKVGKRHGTYWKPWNAAVTGALAELQNRTQRSCAHGGWIALDRWSYEHGGPIYATALNVLTLQMCE